MKTIYRNAFTIMECLIVVLLIGIVVAFIVPSYSKIQIKMTEKTAAANLRMIESSILLYRSQNSSSPSSNLSDISQINTTFGLNIFPDILSYSCRFDQAPGDYCYPYECAAQSPDGWQLHICGTEPQNHVHCNTGTLPRGDCPSCWRGVGGGCYIYGAGG